MQCIKEYKLNHVICISERRFQVSILPIWLFYPMLIPSNMNGKPIKSDQIHLQTLSYMYPNTFESSETWRMLRMDISQFYLWFGASNFPFKKSNSSKLRNSTRFCILIFLCSIPSIITRKGVNMNYKPNGYEKKCKLGLEVQPTKWTAKMNDWMHCGE